MSDKPTSLLPLCFSVSTVMEKQQAPFFLYLLVPSSASNLFSVEPQEIESESQSSSSCSTELTLSCGLSPTSIETQNSTASMKRKLWKIKKVLTQSDVNECGKLLMAKYMVDKLVLPVMNSKPWRDLAKNGILVVLGCERRVRALVNSQAMAFWKVLHFGRRIWSTCLPGVVPAIGTSMTMDSIHPQVKQSLHDSNGGSSNANASYGKPTSADHGIHVVSMDVVLLKEVQQP